MNSKKTKIVSFLIPEHHEPIQIGNQTFLSSKDKCISILGTSIDLNNDKTAFKIAKDMLHEIQSTIHRRLLSPDMLQYISSAVIIPKIEYALGPNILTASEYDLLDSSLRKLAKKMLHLPTRTSSDFLHSSLGFNLTSIQQKSIASIISSLARAHAFQSKSSDIIGNCVLCI